MFFDPKNLKLDTTDFFQGLEPTPHLPELRLMVAVLQRAVADYTDPKSSDYLRCNASRWLFSPSRRVMSVWWICSLLSEEPEKLRKRIVEEVKLMKDKPKSVLFRVDRS